jgi:hypothetical protein
VSNSLSKAFVNKSSCKGFQSSLAFTKIPLFSILPVEGWIKSSKLKGCFRHRYFHKTQTLSFGISRFSIFKTVVPLFFLKGCLLVSFFFYVVTTLKLSLLIFLLFETVNGRVFLLVWRQFYLKENCALVNQ